MAPRLARGLIGWDTSSYPSSSSSSPFITSPLSSPHPTPSIQTLPPLTPPPLSSPHLTPPPLTPPPLTPPPPTDSPFLSRPDFMEHFEGKVAESSSSPARYSTTPPPFFSSLEVLPTPSPYALIALMVTAVRFFFFNPRYYTTPYSANSSVLSNNFFLVLTFQAKKKNMSRKSRSVTVTILLYCQQ